jgi:hypothetical protein
MANHASTHTTQLYDWRRDEMTLDEVEKIGILKPFLADRLAIPRGYIRGLFGIT